MPRTIKSNALLTVAALAAGLCFAAPALAQDKMPAPPKQVAQPNAALLYWPQWVLVPADIRTKMGDIDWDKVYAESDASKRPQNYRDAAAWDGLLNVADGLKSASATSRCDFEVRYDDGFMALLPHLSHARTGVRVLKIAAHEKLLAGDADAAAAYVAAMTRCATHVSGDGVLISSLVGIAAGMSACEEAGEVFKSNKLSQGARDELLKALRSLDTPDPMNIRATLAFEGHVIPNYVERTYTGPKSGEQIAALFKEMNNPGPESAKALEQIGRLDEAAVRTELRRVRAVYDEIYAAWNLDDDVSKLRAISQRTASGAEGPVAQLLCPSLEKAFASAKKFRETVRATVASAPK